MPSKLHSQRLDSAYESFTHQDTTSKDSATSDTFVPRLRVDLFLRGLATGDNRSPSDAYCPQVRRSALDLRSNFEHFDTISTWKNLSITQAEELCFWENAFQQALEELVARVLMDAFVEQENGSKGPRDENLILRRLLQYIKTLEVKTIYIDMQELIRGMLDLYYDDEIHNRHNWFVSSRNLPMAICNFLRTRDCFRESYPDPQVKVSFSAKRVPGQFRLDIFGDVMWFAPDVRPMCLPEIASPGSELRLVPQYLEHILEDQWSSYPVESEYDILSKGKMSLAWDRSIQGFRGIVPGRSTRNQRVSPSKPGHTTAQYGGRLDQLNVVEVELTATLTKEFPGDVRFKLESRFKARVRIAPSPYELRWFPSNPIFGDASNQSSFKPEPHMVEDEVHSKPDHEQAFFRVQHDIPQRVNSWIASFENTPVSKRGIPASRDDSYLSKYRGVHEPKQDIIAQPVRGYGGSHSLDKSDGPISSFRLPSPLNPLDTNHIHEQDCCEQVTQPSYKDSEADSDVPLEMAIYRRGGGSNKKARRMLSRSSDASLRDSTLLYTNSLYRPKRSRRDTKIQIANDIVLPFRESPPISNGQEDEVPLMEDMGPGGGPTSPLDHINLYKASRTLKRDSCLVSYFSDTDSEEPSTVYNLRASPAAPSHRDASTGAEQTYDYFGFPSVPSAVYRSRCALPHSPAQSRVRAEGLSQDKTPRLFKALRIVSDHLKADQAGHSALEYAFGRCGTTSIQRIDSPFIGRFEPVQSSDTRSNPFSNKAISEGIMWTRELRTFDLESSRSKADLLPRTDNDQYNGKTPSSSPMRPTRRSHRIITPQQSQIQANYEAFLKQKEDEPRRNTEDDLAAWIIDESASQEWESATVGEGDESDDEAEAMRENEMDEEMREGEVSLQVGAIEVGV